MSRPVDEGATIDLRSFDLHPGESREIVVALEDEDIEVAGARYRLTVDGGAARVRVTNAHSGWHVELTASGRLAGPCWRCLQPTEVALRADASDFSAFGRTAEDAFDEDLDSEYVAADRLDAVAMARDGLLDQLPAAIHCRDDCAGLCPTCGIDRNTGTCDCGASEPDGRWSALAELRDRLEPDSGS